MNDKSGNLWMFYRSKGYNFMYILCEKSNENINKSANKFKKHFTIFNIIV